ncbi:MAG: type II methionyl aminopeptidase [Methanotrichaceae archaeon]|nr:type II methionyl aminopeptidase [Methanotrichaceae archaeon]
MEPEVLEKYRLAGKILAEVMREAKSRIVEDVTLLEVAELVESSIRSKGAEPAFPCNISLDRSAAHYTPSSGDKSIFGESMVKLDVGVHCDGYIADAAVTVDLSGHFELAEVSNEALEAAIDVISPGVNTSEIGLVIERAISGHGFKPVSNLTGHGLLRYEAHAEPSIPNRPIEKGILLKEGDVIAIEPFATNGFGRISEAPTTEIFCFKAHKPVRSQEARLLMKHIIERYKTLPFARRWLKGARVDLALMQLFRAGVLHRYPVLWEVEGALVSQSEHTVAILNNGCEVITR